MTAADVVRLERAVERLGERIDALPTRDQLAAVNGRIDALVTNMHWAVGTLVSAVSVLVSIILAMRIHP